MCHACQAGDHKHHVRNYAPAPPGVMGGSMCACEGECVERGPSGHLAREIERIHRAGRKDRRDT